MIHTTPPVADRECGPRCISVFLGFILLAGVGAWTSFVLDQPAILFLGMVGICAGLVMTASRKPLVHLAVSSLLLIAYISPSTPGGLMGHVPEVALAILGLVTGAILPWVMTGMGRIQALRYPSAIHLALLLLVAIPISSLLVGISLQPLLIHLGAGETPTLLLQTIVLHGLGMYVCMPITMAIFTIKSMPRFDRVRLAEMVIASLLIVFVQLLWLQLHNSPKMPYVDWMLPLQITLSLIPMLWLSARLGVFGASLAIFVMGISVIAVHTTMDMSIGSDGATVLAHRFIDEVTLVSSGLISLVLGVTSDNLVRSRVNAQRNLNEVQSLVDASGAGIIQTSCDGVIHYANRYASRLLNTEKTVVGTRLHDYVKHDHQQRMERMLNAARLSEDVEFELPVIAGESTDHWRLAVATYQPPANGRPEYLTISIVDLSSARRREASRLRTESERLQRETQEHISNLTSAMLSDANNLAMAVSGTAVQARNTGTLDITMFRDVLDRIESTCIETTSMFERYRRASGAELPNSKYSCNVTGILHDTLQKHANDIIMMPYTVPELPVFVGCDPEFVRFAIEQVVLNSIEASHDTVTLDISMERQPRDNSVKIMIQDDGPGIHAEDLPLVTKPFFTRKARGRGLGLSSIVDGLEHVGGRLRIESHPPTGTCVTINLPLAHIEAPTCVLESKPDGQPLRA